MSWLTENVRHFVLEVLRGDKWVQKLPTTLKHRVDLATAASEVGVIVEGLPQVIDRLAAGLRTSINKNTNLGLNGNRKKTESTPYIKNVLQASFQ